MRPALGRRDVVDPAGQAAEDHRAAGAGDHREEQDGGEGDAAEEEGYGAEEDREDGDEPGVYQARAARTVG
jgi:hypothetical protein